MPQKGQNEGVSPKDSQQLRLSLEPLVIQAQSLCSEWPESWNHRIVGQLRLKGTLTIIHFQPSAVGTVASCQIRLPRALSNLALNTSREWPYTVLQTLDLVNLGVTFLLFWTEKLRSNWRKTEEKPWKHRMENTLLAHEDEFFPQAHQPLLAVPGPCPHSPVWTLNAPSPRQLTSSGCRAAKWQEGARAGCASCYFYFLIMPWGFCYFPLFISGGNYTAKVCSLVLAFSAKAWNAFIFSICSQK